MEFTEVIKNRIKQIINGIDQAFGTQSEYFETMGYPVLINDSQLYSKTISKLSKSEFYSTSAVMMAEDFAYFSRQIKGMFAFIGTGGKPLHSNTFDFYEDVLNDALEYYIRVCEIE